VYSSETLCVEESVHVKFDDKERGNEIPEQGESFADMQVPENTSEPDQTSESEESPEADPLQKFKMVPSKPINPRILSSTSLQILKIKSLKTKKVL